MNNNKLTTRNHRLFLQLLSSAKVQSLANNQKSEQGISLVLSLLMGMIIIAAASGLLMRQLSERSRGAGESYQQMAENSAANGFNRILSALNNSSPGEYLGYLFLNDHNGTSNSKWLKDISLEQPCSKNIKNNGQAPNWMTERNTTEESLRADTMGAPESHFKLRAYYGPQEGQSATFEVEGLVTKENSKNSYEARSLLRRSLYINSKVATADDWAALAAKNLKLGNMKIDGNGHILWLMSNIGNFNDSDSCNAPNLLGAVGANNVREAKLGERIWPVINLTGNQWDLPTPERFNKDGTIDQSEGSPRIWSFDDNVVGNPINEDYGLECEEGYSVVCSRPLSNNPQSSQYSKSINNNQISLTPKTLKAYNKCMITNTFDHNKHGRIYAGNVYPNANISKENCKKRSYREWKEEVSYEVPESREIQIKSSDLCRDTANEDVCHIFVEHIDLSHTKVLIQTDDRPVVMHLELPPGSGSRRPDLSNFRYSLQGNSKFCGADGNSLSRCNNIPESFIIVSMAGDVGTTCDNNNEQSTLSFGDNNLPAAWINLPKGKVELSSDTNLNGVIWANSICAGAESGPLYQLSMNTDGQSNKSIFENAEDYWDWDERKRYGRKVIRGVRGTGFDTFTRF